MPKVAKSPPGALSQEIAAIIRSHMARRNINKVQLSKASGISRTQLGAYVNAVKQMDIEELDQVCFALGLKLREVVAEAEAATASRHAEAAATARPLEPGE